MEPTTPQQRSSAQRWIYSIEPSGSYLIDASVLRGPWPSTVYVHSWCADPNKRKCVFLGEAPGRAVFISDAWIFVGDNFSGYYNKFKCVFGSDLFLNAVNFVWVRPQGERAVMILIMVNINRWSLRRRFDWWSICQIWWFLCPLLWKFGFGAGFGRAMQKLTPFLTESIGKRWSNRDDYMPNR